MAACSLPVQSQCYLLNSSPVSTIDRYEICEQKLRAYLGNAADYTRLTITDDMCIPDYAMCEHPLRWAVWAVTWAPACLRDPQSDTTISHPTRTRHLQMVDTL